MFYEHLLCFLALYCNRKPSIITDGPRVKLLLIPAVTVLLLFRVPLQRQLDQPVN